jgi:hypothetical protein
MSESDWIKVIGLEQLLRRAVIPHVTRLVIPPGSRLDLTKAEFEIDELNYNSLKLKGFISAIRVSSSQCSLSTMVRVLDTFDDLLVLEVDTHLPDTTRHIIMRAPTQAKVLAHPTTIGLRMGCCDGDGKWNTLSVSAEERLVPAIMRDLNLEALETLDLKPSDGYSADYVQLTVLDKLAEQCPNLTQLAISVSSDPCGQIIIPDNVLKLSIYLECGDNGSETMNILAPSVTHLAVEPRDDKSNLPAILKGFDEGDFNALREIYLKDVQLRPTKIWPSYLRTLIFYGAFEFEPVGRNDIIKDISIRWTDVSTTQLLQLKRFAPQARVKLSNCGFSDLPKVSMTWDIDSDSD